MIVSMRRMYNRGFVSLVFSTKRKTTQNGEIPRVTIDKSLLFVLIASPDASPSRPRLCKWRNFRRKNTLTISTLKVQSTLLVHLMSHMLHNTHATSYSRRSLIGQSALDSFFSSLCFDVISPFAHSS